MAVNANPFADASKLAARFATGGMDTPRADFDMFEMSDGKLTYSLTGDDYVYEVSDFGSENPTITIVESPISGKRRIPVDQKANPGAYNAIAEQLSGPLMQKLDTQMPSMGRDEAAADARLEEQLQGDLAEAGMDRDPIRLEDKPQPTGPSFEPSGAVSDMLEMERMEQMPPTPREAIAAREAELQEDLAEIEEDRISGGKGGFQQDELSAREVDARRSAKAEIDPIRTLMRMLRKRN